MKRRSILFQAPGRVETVHEPLPAPAPGEVLVTVALSAISAGTELLILRGLAPPEMALDATLPALAGTFRFPLRYGYAAAGTVTAAGGEVDPAWVGRRVFGFCPHASHILADPDGLVPIPDDLSWRDALFLANMETAVTLVLDGMPALGEHVVLFGQGVVGLLTTSVLAASPLASLLAVEPLALRRDASLRAGAGAVFDSGEALTDHLERMAGRGMADLVYELSGRPEALDAAIAAAGFGARVVVGSWYGTAAVSLNLGGRFHRSRIRLIGSQVSTLPPAAMARWN
ncbi:MAG: zinc-binding dehydrogenase, partial [Desulfobacterales bacterium]|nr:zinc-binding dehydrogenase [Desulfobacterales bacterium]